MPGTNYSYEQGFMFDLSYRYKDIANELLSSKELSDLIFLV